MWLTGQASLTVPIKFTGSWTDSGLGVYSCSGLLFGGFSAHLSLAESLMAPVTSLTNYIT